MTPAQLGRATVGIILLAFAMGYTGRAVVRWWRGRRSYERRPRRHIGMPPQFTHYQCTECAYSCPIRDGRAATAHEANTRHRMLVMSRPLRSQYEPEPEPPDMLP